MNIKAKNLTVNYFIKKENKYEVRQEWAAILRLNIYVCVENNTLSPKVVIEDRRNVNVIY